MIKAVLLDLDDTLLTNSDKVFVPALLAEMNTFFAREYQIREMGAVVAGTMQQMATSSDFHITNSDIAAACIGAAVGQPPETLIAGFTAFYQDIFPRLRKHTTPRPTAVKVVEELKERGIAVIIATNPVYPTPAIHHRLVWAGVEPIEQFSFITTGDDMHFTKPNPAYYGEILARAGFEPEDAVMVGNSLRNDIVPANQMGLHTYHIQDAPTASPADTTGTLDDFLAAVREGWLESRTQKPLHPDMIVPELTGNLGALFGLLALVAPHQWAEHPLPNEWSIIEIVYHLLNHEASVERARLERIYHEDDPFLGVPPPDKPELESCIDEGMVLAHAFAAERRQTLKFLESFTQADWKRTARHSIFSNTTLLEMAHFIAQHDRMHITQICQTLSRCN
jgi:FMN phosphatase YigB (HAD superfamily)